MGPRQSLSRDARRQSSFFSFGIYPLWWKYCRRVTWWCYSTTSHSRWVSVGGALSNVGKNSSLSQNLLYDKANDSFVLPSFAFWHRVLEGSFRHDFLQIHWPRAIAQVHTFCIDSVCRWIFHALINSKEILLEREDTHAESRTLGDLEIETKGNKLFPFAIA